MKLSYSLILLPIITLLVLLFTTDPQSTPSFVLIIPFVLIFTSLLFISFGTLRRRGMNKRSSWGVAAFIALLPTLLLVFQSLGQLTSRDIITIFAFFALTYFYLMRIRGSAK
jgi:hypothetical protein